MQVVAAREPANEWQRQRGRCTKEPIMRAAAAVGATLGRSCRPHPIEEAGA
jgi:hypothetical protein